ncbi:MAG: maltose ABC transporter substrate-binding protein [Micrococcales bacterium]|nr:maltose ABC transporter substrate-binding protein [Micrococcales bacterium]
MKSTRLFAGLAAASLLALPACSGGSGSGSSSSTGSATDSASGASSSATSAAAGGGTLTIWADDKRAAALKPFAEQFGKDNGVTVKVQAVSKDLQAAFVTASQAGNAPDVVVGAHDWIGNMVQNGAVDPVQLADEAAFDPQAVKAVTYDGQVYGVPYAVENLALIRNTKLAPNAPKSMEDLVKTGKELKTSGKAKEIMALQAGQNGDVYHLQPLVNSAGGSLFGMTSDGMPDAKQVKVNSPETVAALKKIAALGEKGSGALKRSITAENAISTFTSGKAAYLVSGPWAITDVKKANMSYDVSAIPAFEGGKPATPFIGTQAFYVASKGKNKSLAQEFTTNFVATPELHVALYKAEPRRPALVEAADQVKGSDADIEKFKAAGEGGLPLPAIPQMSAIWEPMGKAEAAIIGGADVQKSLDAAAAAVKKSIG